MARDLINKGLTLIAREKGEYVGTGVSIDSTEGLNEFENKIKSSAETYYSVNLKPSKKYKNGLVCVDVDNPLVWEMIMGAMEDPKSILKGCIVNPTLRGGHLIFQAENKEKSKVGVLLNIGFKADYLTDKVSVLSPGKFIYSEEKEISELKIIPEILCKSNEYYLPPIIQGGPILEGFRNDALFKFVNRNKSFDIETKRVLACLLGQYFCKPPLDISECLSLVKKFDESFSKKEDVSSRNEETCLKLANDVSIVEDSLRNEVVFDDIMQHFYTYTGTHWKPTSRNTILLKIENLLWENAKKIQTPLTLLTTLTVARNHVTRMEINLRVPPSWRDIPSGINWQNGYLVLDTQELLPHTPERWVTDVRSTAYNPEELLSYENQKLIAQACGGSIHKVNALLTCGNRAILPKPNLETSYYFSGPAVSGKGLFTSCFMRLCGNNAVSCELADVEKGFARAELVKKTLIVFNEFIQMKDQNEKFIKSFIGRDSQSYEIKYVQGHKSDIFKGIIIIVSNLGPDLTYGSSSAMNDRFIPIEFSPRLGAANPLLSKQLEDNESGFINLLINVDPDIFPHLTRAGLFNKEMTYETNILVPFILNKLYFEVGSCVSIQALLEGYKNWTRSNPIKKSRYIFDLTIDLASVALTLFNRRLTKGRRIIDGRRIQVLVGVRWREKTDPNQDTLQNSFVMENDPWLSLRKKNDHPIYEIDTYRQDLEKANKTIAPNGALISVPDPLPTTPVVQKQYLAEVLPIKFKKTGESPVEIKLKSRLVFSESTFLSGGPQFSIPGKLSDKELGVTKITNKDEQHKYLDKLLPSHPQSFFIKGFEECFQYFKLNIGNPLKKLVFEEEFAYHPHSQFKETEIVRKRIFYLSKLGDVSSKLEELFGSRHILLCESLRAAQLKFPVPPHKTAHKQNLFQTKNNFTGHLFPTYYYFDSMGSPRLKSYPGHTIRDGHKAFRNEVFKRFSQYCGFYIYETDLSSCYVRVIMMFLTEQQAPLLYKSFTDKDLYLETALELKSGCDALHVFPDKLLRKIIKIKCLAMLNGGGLMTKKHIDHLVEGLYKKDSEDYNKIMDILLPELAGLPIVREFRSHGQYIAEEERVFILTHNSGITSSDSKHILSSPVMCAVESLTMTFLLEYISTLPKNILPLTTIHDGIALLSRYKLSVKDLNDFNNGFSDFVTKRLGIPLPIETESVGFDFENNVG